MRKKIRGKVEGFLWPWTYSSKFVCPKNFHLELQVYSYQISYVKADYYVFGNIVHGLENCHVRVWKLHVVHSVIFPFSFKKAIYSRELKTMNELFYEMDKLWKSLRHKYWSSIHHNHIFILLIFFLYMN